MGITQDWIDAQHAVLGAVLLDQRLAPQVLHECSESDFGGSCQEVYRVMRELFMAGTPVDLIPIASKLDNSYKPFLAKLMEITPTTANLSYYIEQVKREARVQKIQAIGLELETVSNLDTAKKLIEDASGALVARSQVKAYTMADCLKRFMTRHTGETHYLSWPVAKLNQHIYAEPGDFIIVGGLPSTGKSAWSLQCAWHWAKDHRVGFYSLETATDRLFDRQMAGLTQISKDTIKRNQLGDDDWARVASLTTEITSRKLEIIEAAGWTVADIKAHAMQRGYEIILIDYIQLVAAVEGYNRTEQVGSISRAMHLLAQELKITVVAMSQLSRPKDGGSLPDMSQLRESGQLEQDADIILMLKLEDEKNPDGARILRTAKNKEGERRKYRLAFDGKTQLFSYAPEETGDTGQAFRDAGKKAQQKRRSESYNQGQDAQQMYILPDNYPVPF